MTKTAQTWPKAHAAWGDLFAIDGSWIDAVLSMAWGDYRQGSKEATVHVGFELNHSIPGKIFLADGKGDQRPFVNQILSPGQTGVMDRYYQCHKTFAIRPSTSGRRPGKTLSAASKPVHARPASRSIACRRAARSSMRLWSCSAPATKLKPNGNSGWWVIALTMWRIGFHKLFSQRTIPPGSGGLYTSVRGQRSSYPRAFGAAHGLPAEARESSANTRMIIRGRFSAVVDSSITPA